MMKIERNDKILFIGDSITDCGRNYDDVSNMGGGYTKFIAARLQTEIPEFELNFVNTGISGHRVLDLKNRWKKDCIDHDPDIVSILVGINDVWRRYDSNDPVSIDDFEDTYQNILEMTKGINAKIVMMEPFLFPHPPEFQVFREDLDPKIRIVRKLAVKYADAYIPLDGMFAAASCRYKSDFWSGDGIHPSDAGHQLIANAWFDGCCM